MITILRLDKSQKKELAKYWFDISKLVLASLVLKLFEPGLIISSQEVSLTLISGLTSSILLVILGLRFAKD